MKFVWGVTFLMLSLSAVYAEVPDHHEHKGTTQLEVNYEFLDFENSKQKDDGRRYGLRLDHQDDKHHFLFYMEHTDTATKAHIPKDLSVNKYALKYQYSLNKKQTLSFVHIQVNDNLIDAVDEAKVYGLGISHKSLSLMQYFSDYKDFDVYQTDLKWGMKKDFETFTLKGALIGKYMHVDDSPSSVYTKNVKQDYFTVGAKVHAELDDWHFATVGYVGERIFAVMNEGLRVQHHAMAFDKSYMFSVGKKFNNTFVKLRYIKQFATEVPLANEDVEVSNIILSLSYSF